MKKIEKNNNQVGFSLIELMMVVVIIGVLAGVGIPQYQKFQMKARQSEVKSLLTSMYTAQKAFYAEWNQYYGDFNAVGYGVSGDLGYNVGFSVAGNKGPSTHPNATYNDKVPKVKNSGEFCKSNTACSITKSRTTKLVASTSAKLATFLFGGRANLDSDTTEDQWTINEVKKFSQGADDITN